MFNIFVLLLSFNCILFHVSNGEKLIIDTDAGVDDAIAILLMLAHEKSQSPKFETIAVTCTHGNTEEENVEKNVLKILTVASRDDIPVYGGAKEGFIESFFSDYPYGRDGLGDADLDLDVTAKIDRSKHAAQALVELAKRNSGNVSIVAIGPLSNIGLAIALDKNFTNHVNHFYVMGGTAVGIGNRRPNVEFNFAADPESNFALFNATRESQITLLPWETAWNIETTKDWRKNVLGKHDHSPYVRFLNKIEAQSLAHEARWPQWLAADAMIVACMIEPRLITEHAKKRVEAVTDGKARGAVLVDYQGLQSSGRVENTRIVRATDEALYKEMLIEYLTVVR